MANTNAHLIALTLFVLVFLPNSAIAKVTIFAAASTAAPVNEIIKLFNADKLSTKQGKVVASFAASSTLAKQIAYGAPADIYISANPQWMDFLAAKKAIEPSSRFDFLGNRLVLVAPKDSSLAIRIAPSFPLAEKLADNRLAIGDPDHVPAGIYAKAALINLGAWQSLSRQVVRTQDVRAALALVERGEAEAGIVYASDALISRKVRVVAEFPPTSHPPIIYPAAIVAGKQRAEVNNFFAMMKSAVAANIFTKYGFVVIAFYKHNN